MNDAPRTLADLELLVAERAEESIRLEFKRELPPSTKNDALSTDLAAMANSEGGVIVWGIQEEEGRASQIVPFDVARTAERVTLVARGLDEPLSIPEVYSVPVQPNSQLAVLIAVVPQSLRRPHFFHGTAWGRNAKGNYQLSRREVGELYARSTGFAAEFGLQVGRPGRLRVDGTREVRPGTTGSINHYLQFENDGDSEILDADWWWVEHDERAATPANPFPYSRLEPGARPRVFVNMTSSQVNRTVKTAWKDSQGRGHEAQWPITWL